MKTTQIISNICPVCKKKVLSGNLTIGVAEDGTLLATSPSNYRELAKPYNGNYSIARIGAKCANDVYAELELKEKQNNQR